MVVHVHRSKRPMQWSFPIPLLSLSNVIHTKIYFTMLSPLLIASHVQFDGISQLIAQIWEKRRVLLGY